MATTPREQIDNMDTKTFFSYFTKELKNNSPQKDAKQIEVCVKNLSAEIENRIKTAKREVKNLPGIQVIQNLFNNFM